MPVVHRTRDVRVLAAFVTATKQQHDFGTRLGVIHAVASANIDAQFPYAVATKLVVAEVALLDAADTFDYLHLGDGIAKVLEPIQVRVFAFGVEIVANVVHDIYSSINEYMSILILLLPMAFLLAWAVPTVPISLAAGCEAFMLPATPPGQRQTAFPRQSARMPG